MSIFKKSTIDTYTGKKFTYDPYLQVKIGKLNTVGRYDRRERRYIFLHPSRLTPQLFSHLNSL